MLDLETPNLTSTAGAGSDSPTETATPERRRSLEPLAVSGPAAPAYPLAEPVRAVASNASRIQTIRIVVLIVATALALVAAIAVLTPSSGTSTGTGVDDPPPAILIQSD